MNQKSASQPVEKPSKLKTQMEARVLYRRLLAAPKGSKERRHLRRAYERALANLE